MLTINKEEGFPPDVVKQVVPEPLYEALITAIERHVTLHGEESVSVTIKDVLYEADHIVTLARKHSTDKGQVYSVDHFKSCAFYRVTFISTNEEPWFLEPDPLIATYTVREMPGVADHWEISKSDEPDLFGG